MKNTILFDLDGTLIDVDTDEFIDQYFKLLTFYFKDDIPLEKMGPALKKAVYDMMSEVGNNKYEVFCDSFHDNLGVTNGIYEPKFQEFYLAEFDKLKPTMKRNENVGKALENLKSKGYELVLATNPAFPMLAQQKRLTWGNYKVEDFKLITSCDNSIACKPFKEYYNEILEKIGAAAQNCMMIGNDVDDDMVTTSILGLDTYLVTDNFINKKGTEYNGKKGTSSDFLIFAQSMPNCIV